MPRSENPLTPRKVRLGASARRALEMLSNDFATESIMLGYGSTSRLLAELVRNGLAMLYRAPLNAGKKTVQVTYIMVTNAGRRALKATATVDPVHRPRRRKVSSQRRST